MKYRPHQKKRLPANQLATYISEVVAEESEVTRYEEETPDIAPEDSLPTGERKRTSRTDSPVQTWDYISLSEESVVIKLIRTRSLVDTYYVAQRYANPSPLMSDGVVTFAEHILTTFIDLDTLINECGLTPDEHNLVTALMDGYTVRDLVEDDGIYKCSADVFTALDIAARKIVVRNNERWEKSVEMSHRRQCQKAIAKKKWRER